MTHSVWRTAALLILCLSGSTLITSISVADSGWARIKRPVLSRSQRRTIELLNDVRKSGARELQDLLARHEQEVRINPNGPAAEILVSDAQRQALFLKAIDAKIKQLSNGR